MKLEFSEGFAKVSNILLRDGWARSRWAKIGWGAAVAGLVLAATIRAFAINPPPKGAYGTTDLTVQQKLLDRMSTSPLVAPARVHPEVWAKAFPPDNEVTPLRVALGRRLFFDPRLSKDGTVACATCHDVARAFTDGRPVSVGIGQKRGRRNAPSVANAMLQDFQFLDGRATTLEAQAALPLLSSVEMGNPSRKAVVLNVKEDRRYQRMFQKAYGRQVSFEDIARAIASFERTLVFLDAPFDRFMAGEIEAISSEARRGYELFHGKARCSFCHPINEWSPLGSDNRCHNIGVSAMNEDFESLADWAVTAFKEEGTPKDIHRFSSETDLSSLGRFLVSKRKQDIGAFKTSPIRNVGVTAPYMHDGSMRTLWDVVDHYNRGGRSHRYLDGSITPLGLTESEIDQLVAFLFTLTDVRFTAQNDAERVRQWTLAQEARPFRQPRP